MVQAPAGNPTARVMGFLTLTTRGFVVPQQSGHREVRLEPADLVELAEWARREAEGASGPAGAVGPAVSALVDRGWRSTSAPPAAPPRPRLPVTTALGVDDGSDRPTDDQRAEPQEFVVPTPLTIAVTPSGFGLRCPDGSPSLTVGPRELATLAVFRRHLDPEVAYTQHGRVLGDSALDRPTFDQLVARARATGVLVAYERGWAGHDGVFVTDDDDPHEELRLAEELTKRLEQSLFTAGAGRTDPAVAATKVPVVPVTNPHLYPNLALGLLLASAGQDAELTDRYDLGPHWGLRRKRVRRFVQERGPAVLLASDYVWSSPENLEVTRLVKELAPESVVIHGGPNVPRQPADVEQFLRTHPHVDVVVRNEGEMAIRELLTVLDGRLDGHLPTEALADIAGITYRDGDRLVRTADRARITDLDALPSPYLTGLFDEYDAARFAILETNRGCPYGCTFCDWGSATTSRVRFFSLDRVFAELEWCARHEIPLVVIADANFGIHSRDVSIAEHVAVLKRRFGFPKEMRTNYAKHTNKHLEKIIRVLVDAEVSTEAVVSLQTTDEATLQAVRRTNIRTERYDELAATFRRERLPLSTELMLGLPGATVASFDHDLQRCIDREVPARIYRTELLVNSPMNAPEYRERYQIQFEMGDDQPVGQSGRQRPLLVSTSSYTEADLRLMLHHRQLYHVADSYGVLRHVGRFLHQETGRPEFSLYVTIDELVRSDPGAYPHLAWGLATIPTFAVAPQSWELFYDDVHRLVQTELGVTATSALDTVLSVQVALAPERDRVLPARYELAHDYVAWWQAMVDAKEDGGEWIDRVPRLGDLGPGELEVSDPTDLIRRTLGRPLDMGFYGQWDLHSAVSRPGAMMVHRKR